MFPKVPPIFPARILRVPQEHPLPLNTPGPLRTLQRFPCQHQAFLGPRPLPHLSSQWNLPRPRLLAWKKEARTSLLWITFWGAPFFYFLVRSCPNRYQQKPWRKSRWLWTQTRWQGFTQKWMEFLNDFFSHPIPLLQIDKHSDKIQSFDIIWTLQRF